MEQAASNSGQRLEVIVGGDEGSLRLDRVLAVLRPELSRSRLKALILAGSVTAKGAPIRDPAYHVTAGDTITIDVPPAVAPEPKGEDIALDIIHEDDDIIVIDKPRGLVVHPAAGHRAGTLVNALIAHCGDSLSGIGGVKRPGIVHRLDKDTSGLMVVGKTLEAVTALTRSIAAREVHRQYLTIVHGEVRPAAFSIDAPIGRDPQSRVRMAIVASGKPARTDVQTVACTGGFSALRCTLHTGRTHQIRVHLAARGHPIVGDDLYGGATRWRGVRDTLRRRALAAVTRPLLHAARIEIAELGVDVSAPLPEDYRRLLKVLSP